MPIRPVAAVVVALMLAQQRAAVAQDTARFYIDRADEYAAERKAIQTSRQSVERSGGRLRIRFENGTKRELVDTLAEGDHFRRFLYAGYLRAQRVHIVQVDFYEGGAIELLYGPTGQDTIVAGWPQLSPDGTRFVVSSLGLPSGYDPNILEIWRVGREGMRREFSLSGDDRWGPDSVRWNGNNNVSFLRVTLSDRGDLIYGRSPYSVRRVGNTWVSDSTRK